MFKLAFVAACVVCFQSTYGYRLLREEIPNGYNVKHPCPGKGIWEAVGHMQPRHVKQKNMFGQAMKAADRNWHSICNQDSDGDGLTNGEELGDPECRWRRGGNFSPGPVLGHPGFCEQGRNQCTRGMSHPECPFGKATHNGHGNVNNPTPAVRPLPSNRNVHPNTIHRIDIGIRNTRVNRDDVAHSQRGFIQTQHTPLRQIQQESRWQQPQHTPLEPLQQERRWQQPQHTTLIPPQQENIWQQPQHTPLGPLQQERIWQQPQQIPLRPPHQERRWQQPQQPRSYDNGGSVFGVPSLSQQANPPIPRPMPRGESASSWTPQRQQPSIVEPNSWVGNIGGVSPQYPQTPISMFSGQVLPQTSLNQEVIRRNVQNRINRERSQATGGRHGSSAGRTGGGVGSYGRGRPSTSYSRTHDFQMYP